MSVLSNNILTIREIAGMTQPDFAKRVCGEGVTKGMIGSYEREVKPATPSLIVLQRIADFAGVTGDDLQKKILKEADLSAIKENKVKKENIDIKVKTNDSNSARDIKEKFMAIDAQFRVILLVLIELMSEDPSKPKKSVTEAGLYLANLIRQETKQQTDELNNK